MLSFGWRARSPRELFVERGGGRRRGASERAGEGGAEIGQRALDLGCAPTLAGEIEARLAGERERDAEQTLHDALVDIAREVDAVSQQATLFAGRSRFPGHARHRDHLAEGPEQVALVIVHLARVRLALGDHHADVLTGRCHRRADDRHIDEQVLDGLRHVEVLGADDFADPVFQQRLPGDRHGVDRHEQM